MKAPNKSGGVVFTVSFASLFNFLTCIVPNYRAHYTMDGWVELEEGPQIQLSVMEYLMNYG